MPSLVDYRLTPTAGTNLSVTRTRLRSGSPRGRYLTNERASAKAGKNPVIDDDEIADRTGLSAQDAEVPFASRADPVTLACVPGLDRRGPPKEVGPATHINRFDQPASRAGPFARWSARRLITVKAMGIVVSAPMPSSAHPIALRV